MMSSMAKRVMVNRLPPKGPDPGGHEKSTSPASRHNFFSSRDHSPVSWRQYFHHAEQVDCNGDVFNVYMCGSKGPVLFLVHGGGFSALSWALFSAKITSLVECRCAAIDLRAHGKTKAADENDLSITRLATDVSDVINKLYGSNADPTTVILIGHSLGGSIVVHAAAAGNITGAHLAAIGVIDVVEGTALESLVHMPMLLKSRPKTFKSLESAIEWSVRSKHIRNPASAKVSMVGQLKKCSVAGVTSSESQHHPASDVPTVHSHHNVQDDVITEEGDDLEDTGGGEVSQEQLARGVDRIDVGAKRATRKRASGSPPVPEEKQAEAPAARPPASAEDNETPPGEEAGPSGAGAFATPGADQYTWRIDLGRTEEFWQGWFQDLSRLFLSCPQPKLLLLAGVDRLDKELTIGQMQGKFQMQVLPKSGHAIQEDCPDEVANAIGSFLVRHKLVAALDDMEKVFPCC